MPVWPLAPTGRNLATTTPLTTSTSPPPEAAGAAPRRVLLAADDAPMARVREGDATVRDLVATVLSVAVTEILRQVPGIVAGDDVEAVHRARVATRRLRAELRMLRPVLSRPWADETRAELKWLAHGLGEVRDADVLYAELDKQQAKLPEVDRAEARALAGRVLTERQEPRARLVGMLQSVRFRALMDRLLDGTADPQLRAGDDRADDPAGSVLPSLVGKRHKALVRAMSNLGEDPCDEALHEIRKQSKSLRYVAEASRPFIGSPVKRLARSAERLQDVLGEVHDAAVAQTWLRRQVLITPGASTGLAAGELVDREWQRYLAHRLRWRHAGKRLQRKNVRRSLHQHK